MEPKKMESESLSLEDNGDHQTFSEDSLASNVLSDDEDSPVRPIPRIGSEYQAEIPNLATKDERREANGYGYDYDYGKCDPTLQHIGTKLWTDLEAGIFLLGLYIFGKNLKLLSTFLGTKTLGDVLLYYYGKFFQSDEYKRWSHCKKAKARKRILEERIFQGRRWKELLSRLKSKIPKKAHDSLAEVFKSFGDNKTSLEEFVFALKSIVGMEVFVEAVGLGKGKDDLTEFVTDQSKPNQGLTFPSGLPTGKDWSSLGLEDIIKLLTDDSRKGKERSNDIFWDAVWPRLLGKGWHSEQPKDVRKAKNCIVFLVPGIKRFSRSELTKGTHYFDSVSDVLKKVAADPALLELEADTVLDHGLTVETNGSITDMEIKQDNPLDGYQEFPEFPIVDTSLVEGEEPINVLEMRNLPADAKFSFVPTHHTPNMVSYSSSDEDEDATDEEEGARGGVTAEVKEEIEMVAANGHSSPDGNGNRFDTAGIETEPERRKYLSSVPKRRRLTKNNSGMKQANGGAPSIWNRNMCPDPSEATPAVTVSKQPTEPAALEANPRRQGTRNRPPTARALEAIAFGLLGTGKGKKGGDMKNMARNQQHSQRARKATKDQVPTASSSDWNVKEAKGTE